MYTSKFFNASKTSKHSLSTVETFVSSANNFFAKKKFNRVLLTQYIFFNEYGATTELGTVNLQNEWSFNFGAAKRVNLSKAFEGH